MKNYFLPLLAAAAISLASCGNDMDGQDGVDANDSVENSLQAAGDNLGQGIDNAVDNMGNRIDNATDSTDLHNDKNEADGKDTLRN